MTATYGGSSVYTTATSSSVQQIIADLNVGISSGSQTSATVSACGTATYRLNIAPSNGTTFPQQVTLSATGAPTGSTVLINPQTIAAGAGTTDITLTVQVFAQAAAVTPGTRNWSLAALMFGMLLLPMALVGGGARHAALRIVLLTATLVSAGAFLSCGGQNTAPPGPQAHTYNITVTATSGALTRSTTLTLTVQ